MVCKILTEYTLEKRTEVCNSLKAKYPDRSPVILMTEEKSNFTLEKEKFLVPNDFKFERFISEARKMVKPPIESETGIFFLTNKETILSPQDDILSIYKKHASPDGFLYIYIIEERVFG
jgi:hypothetical protein